MRNSTNEFVKLNLISSYELQKRRKLQSFHAWNSSQFNNRSIINLSKFNIMKYKLTYKIGLAVVQEWIFTSKSLAYWKKMDLIETGRFNMGSFEIEQFDVLNWNKKTT